MFFEKILLECAYLLNLFIPKKKNQVFFYSSPDYSDNSRAVYEEMKRNGLDEKYRIVWAVKDLKKYEHLLTNVKIVKHRSLINLWYFCRSKYIFRTHSLWGNKYVKGKQIMCIVWHGMPLKKLVQKDGNTCKTSCDIITSTSPFFDNELVTSMGLSYDVCKHVGLPRNDDLFSNGNELENRFPNYKRRIIWMPTFRHAKGFKNGIESESGIPCVTFSQLALLNEVLRSLNYLLILKLHPWSFSKISNLKFSNIVSLSDSDLVGNVSLYRMLGQTDALITDYSSVFIDYLLIDKPICFVCDDLDEYRENRGFAFEPVEDYMPGPIVKDFDGIIEWLRNFEHDDYYKKERERVKKLFYVYPDNKSSARLLNEMKII